MDSIPAHLEREFVRKLDFSTRRSPDQLRESFQHVISKYDNEAQKGRLMDFLRAIKQELVSYRQTSPFLVRVMETSAELSIVYKDSDQMNDSFGFLMDFYRSSHRYNSKLLFVFLLILVLERKTMQLERVLMTLPNSVFFDQEQPFSVSRILEVHQALLTNNFLRVYRILNSAQDRCLLSIRDIYIPKLRLRQAQILEKTFKFKLPVSRACEYFGFTDRERQEILSQKELSYGEGESKLTADVLPSLTEFLN